MRQQPPINALPTGILGFLGIKNGGRYPQHLGETLTPVWDLANLYLEANAQYTDDAGTINADGEVRVFTVPEGQVWWVSELVGYITTGAGESLDAFALTRFASGPVQWLSITPGIAVPANQDSAILVMDRPRFLQPGEGLGFEAYGGAYAGVIDWQMGIRFTVLPT